METISADERAQMGATASIPPEIDAQPDDEGQNDSEIDPGADASAPPGLDPPFGDGEIRIEDPEKKKKRTIPVRRKHRHQPIRRVDIAM